MVGELHRAVLDERAPGEGVGPAEAEGAGATFVDTSAAGDDPIQGEIQRARNTEPGFAFEVKATSVDDDGVRQRDVGSRGLEQTTAPDVERSRA